MPDRNTSSRSTRTVLELRIRQRRQTFEEFVQYAEVFAREHGERGTLSLRHLQRLVAGRRPDGAPPGPPRPATARLLEHIFDMSIEQLLAAPSREVIESSSSTAQPLRVAVAIVVKQPEILIVCRRGQDGCGISWQFPAGMVKPGVPAETVAIRETLGETSVHCSLIRELGSRIHPITNVTCHYFLCKYLTGDATNVDVAENVSVTWADKTTLTQFIPTEQIFPPALEALGINA